MVYVRNAEVIAVILRVYDHTVAAFSATRVLAAALTGLGFDQI